MSWLFSIPLRTVNNTKTHENVSVCTAAQLIVRRHGNVFLRFCIVSSNELVVLDSLENSKQYKNAGKRFRVYGA